MREGRRPAPRDEAAPEERGVDQIRAGGEDGVVHEEGPPDRIFGDPHDERTRAFLKRIIEAGRL